MTTRDNTQNTNPLITGVYDYWTHYVSPTPPPGPSTFELSHSNDIFLNLHDSVLMVMAEKPSKEGRNVTKIRVRFTGNTYE